MAIKDDLSKQNECFNRKDGIGYTAQEPGDVRVCLKLGYPKIPMGRY
jgi:hypothetical protein